MEWKLSSMSPWFKGCPLEKLNVVSFFYSFFFAAIGKLLLSALPHPEFSSPDKNPYKLYQIPHHPATHLHMLFKFTFIFKCGTQN